MNQPNDVFIRRLVIESLRGSGERSLRDICKYLGMNTLKGSLKINDYLNPLIAAGIVGTKKYHWWKIRFYLIEEAEDNV